MKLNILEDNDKFIIYVDIVPYIMTLNEDKVPETHKFDPKHKYNNIKDTRWNILTDYIVPIADKFENYDFIDETEARTSGKDDSLSNYIDIVFIHPSELTDSEIKEFYSYTIRFSDHENKHPEFSPVEEVNMNGMIAKNLQKSAMKIFKSKISDIKNDIKKFEIEKFGEQRTFFN